MNLRLKIKRESPSPQRYFQAAFRVGFSACVLASALALPSAAQARSEKQASATPLPTPTPAAVPKIAARTLKDAFDAAVKRSETLGIQRELLVQTNETQSQATGAMLPTISGTASYVHNELPNAAPVSGGGSIFSESRTTKIALDQPLFRGLKDFALLRQRKAAVESQSYALRYAAHQLFSDLTTAYFAVLAYQSDETNYLMEIEQNRKRLGELKHFLQVGRSRQVDLLTFQSNISVLETQLESTRGLLESARETLAYLTGWDRETPILDESEVPSPKAVGDYLANLDSRPDIKAASADKKVAEEGVPIARSGHLPSLDLIGEYYHDRPGVPSGGTDWDMQVVMTVPIFAGGTVNAQIRQARSVVTQAELTLSQKKRLAIQEIRTLYDVYQADLRQIAKLEETVGWSKKAADAQVKDYRTGLVTNLDVLQAITTYQDALRLRDRGRINARGDLAKLEAAAMLRPEIESQAADVGK